MAWPLGATNGVQLTMQHVCDVTGSRDTCLTVNSNPVLWVTLWKLRLFSCGSSRESCISWSVTCAMTEVRPASAGIRAVQCTVVSVASKSTHAGIRGWSRSASVIVRLVCACAQAVAAGILQRSRGVVCRRPGASPLLVKRASGSRCLLNRHSLASMIYTRTCLTASIIYRYSFCRLL